MILHDVTIIDTMDMLEEFERAFGYQLCDEDRLELFHQIFLILDGHNPLDLDDADTLNYDSFIFANHLSVDHAAVDKLAYHLMVKVWEDIQQRGFYINGELMYLPFSMQGWDLCVRRYKN